METNEETSVPRRTEILYISSFSELKKATVNETYRNLHSLIKNREIEKSKFLENLILSPSPLPLFDECLLLSVIDSLQLESEVVRILLTQNDNQIKRILNCKWFFKSLPSEFCTRELFPYVSASVRCKIICKLSKHLESETEAEKYFTFTRKNYGNERAEFLLAKCSEKFILSHFDEHKSSFRHPSHHGVRVLLNISRRYAEVGLHILSYLYDREKHFVLDKYKNVLVYLGGNHPDLFVPFLRKYQSAMTRNTFGGKLTKKLGRRLGGNLFSDLTNVSVFDSRKLFSILDWEGRVKLLAATAGVLEKENLSLRSWKRSSYEMCALLKFARPCDRLQLIEATFAQLYNLDFGENCKFWCCELLELLPVGTREPFVTKLEKYFAEEKSVFEENVDDSFSIEFPEYFVHLYQFETAFGKFKELLRSAPQPSRRQKILNLMVKNCSINSDLKGLEEVVDFVASRHRNDDPSVIYSFVHTICTEFPWTALRSTAYEKLDDLIHLCALRGNLDRHVARRWKERHIYHLYENGRCADALAEAEILFDSIIRESCYPCGSFVEDLKCRHAKALLLALGDAAVRWLVRNPWDSSVEGKLQCLVQTCVRFSAVHPRTDILREVAGLKEILKERSRVRFGDLGGEKWPLDVWRRYCNDVTSVYFAPKCFCYLAKRNIELIEAHLEAFLKMFLENYVKALKHSFNFFLKIVSFFDKTEAIKEILLSEFRSEGSTKRREVALELYSHVASVEEFSAAVEGFVPRGERVGADSDAAFGRIQLLIPDLIRNLRPRSKNFDLLLKFLLGDFLKGVMRSLHSCGHHTRVDVVIPFLKELLTTLPRRVSYQKDIIRLIAELSTLGDRSAFCWTCWQEHQHYSIRAVLFLFLSNLFVEHPTRESFEPLKNCIMEADSITIAHKPKLQDVPDEFLQDYVSALLHFSERQTPAFRTAFLQSVLLHFDGEKINSLSPEFSERIIENHLFRAETSLDVRDFACAYLTHSPDPNASPARVRFVLSLVGGQWKPFSDFLRVLSRWARSRPTAFPDLFGIVLAHWPKAPLGVLFEDRVLFTYHHLHRKVLRTTPRPELVAQELAKELRRFLSDVEHLRDLLPVYAETLTCFLENFQVDEVISVVKELVSGPKDRSLAVLGILALPSRARDLFWADGDMIGGTAAETKMALRDLVNTFESYGDDVVTIYLKKKFFLEKIFSLGDVP